MLYLLILHIILACLLAVETFTYLLRRRTYLRSFSSVTSSMFAQYIKCSCFYAKLLVSAIKGMLLPFMQYRLYTHICRQVYYLHLLRIGFWICAAAAGLLSPSRVVTYIKQHFRIIRGCANTYFVRLLCAV